VQRRARRRRHGDERHRGVVYRGQSSRGATTELAEYMSQHADRILESAAEMHDCEVAVSTKGERRARRATTHSAGIVGEVAGGVAGVTEIVDRADLGGSEDATYLMQSVQKRGDWPATSASAPTTPAGTTRARSTWSKATSRSGSTCSRARSERSPRRGPEAGREQPKSNVGFCRTPIFKL